MILLLLLLLILIMIIDSNNEHHNHNKVFLPGAEKLGIEIQHRSNYQYYFIILYSNYSVPSRLKMALYKSQQGSI